MATAMPRTTPRRKKNLCFIFEFRSCLDLFHAPIGLRTCSSLICNASIQFQKKIRKIHLRRPPSPKYTELCFLLSFSRVRQRNVERLATHVYGYFFCSLNLLFGSFLVAVAAVVCLRWLTTVFPRLN